MNLTLTDKDKSPLLGFTEAGDSFSQADGDDGSQEVTIGINPIEGLQQARFISGHSDNLTDPYLFQNSPDVFTAHCSEFTGIIKKALPYIIHNGVKTSLSKWLGN